MLRRWKSQDQVEITDLLRLSIMRTLVHQTHTIPHRCRCSFFLARADLGVGTPASRDELLLPAWRPDVSGSEVFLSAASEAAIAACTSPGSKPDSPKSVMSSRTASPISSFFDALPRVHGSFSGRSRRQRLRAVMRMYSSRWEVRPRTGSSFPPGPRKRWVHPRHKRQRSFRFAAFVASQLALNCVLIRSRECLRTVKSTGRRRESQRWFILNAAARAASRLDILVEEPWVSIGFVPSSCCPLSLATSSALGSFCGCPAGRVSPAGGGEIWYVPSRRRVMHTPSTRAMRAAWRKSCQLIDGPRVARRVGDGGAIGEVRLLDLQENAGPAKRALREKETVTSSKHGSVKVGCGRLGAGAVGCCPAIDVSTCSRQLGRRRGEKGRRHKRQHGPAGRHHF